MEFETFHTSVDASASPTIAPVRLLAGFLDGFQMGARPTQERLLRTLGLLAVLTLSVLPLRANAIGTLLFIGTDSAGHPYLPSWQDHSGTWHAGKLLPNPGGNYHDVQFCPGEGNTTQAVGLDSNGNTWLISWEDTGGYWHSGFQLPGIKVNFSSIVMGQGANGLVQVIGLDAAGRVYLANWQDANGNWWAGTADTGGVSANGQLNANVGFSSLSLGLSLQNGATVFNVYGINSSGQPVTICTQSNSSSPDWKWTSGSKLPNWGGYQLRVITSSVEETNTLPNLILGLKQSGSGDLVYPCYQTSSGAWRVGGTLPGNQIDYTAFSVTAGLNSTRQVVGLDTSGRPYLASWQDHSGKFHAGFSLSGPVAAFDTIAAAMGSDGHLQVVGLDTNGSPNLICWQNPVFSEQYPDGKFVTGFLLPNPGVPLENLVVGNAGNTANMHL